MTVSKVGNVDLFELVTKNIHDLSTEELKVLLEHYEGHEERHVYERKISQIKRTIRKRQERLSRKDDWKELAKEDKAIKDEWLQKGAMWENIETMTTWYYEGMMYYRYFSNKSIYEEIHRVREADKRFREMISKERCHENL